MSRIFGVILLLVIVAAAGLFYAAPIISFYDVRSACRSQDIESLAKLIDFTSVRTSLKTQLDAGDEGVAAPAPSALNDPVGATGNAIKGVADSVGKAFNDLVNPNATKTPPKPVIDVNTYLTPKALLGLTYGAAKDANTFELSKFEGKPPAPKTAFFSLERARLTVTDDTHGTTTFTFERHGLTHWQLVHIGLPTPDMEPKPETPAG
ncbi:MAG: DUF2939 domain-containing protein [Asticcacaulis sp.]|uniref:DUF2939 domain-containing protein n=1 Tax=Asticcacaulis sp. TaxID=1872648 RepID=UPI0039E51690